MAAKKINKKTTGEYQLVYFIRLPGQDWHVHVLAKGTLPPTPDKPEQSKSKPVEKG